MLTPQQENWINSLNDHDSIVIQPFDSRAEALFQTVKTRLQSVLGRRRPVLQRGATSLGISGQAEIDVYVPVSPGCFYALLPLLTGLLGPPGSLHLEPLDRARYTTRIENKRVEVFLMNCESSSWIAGIRFEEYLKQHSAVLEQYRRLKEDCAGLSTRSYYRQKVEFINQVLSRTGNPPPDSPIPAVVYRRRVCQRPNLKYRKVAAAAARGPATSPRRVP